MENKTGNVISIVSLIVMIIGGLLGYLLKGQFEANELQSSTKLKQSELDLVNINKAIQGLELSIKEHRDKIDVEGKETRYQIDKLDLEIRSIKNTLDITSRKLGISSDLMSLMNDLVPKADLKYDKSESEQLKNQAKPTTRIVHNLLNVGKYPFLVTGYKVFISKNPIHDDTDIRDLFIEGTDYTRNESYKYTGLLSPGMSKPYTIEVSFNQTVFNKYRKAHVTYFVYFKTQQTPVDMMKRYAKDLLNDKEISSLLTGKIRSDTEIDLISNE